MTITYLCGMIQRVLNTKLHEWRLSKNRKPLLLRGARQVGKTTLVNIFANEFEQYIYINLERNKDKKLFEGLDEIPEIIQNISLQKNLDSYKTKETLLFIDEIQELPHLINKLRYFYEDAPELYVIAAGSLLEMTLSKTIKFPVGRINFLVVKPFSFHEFLIALNEEKAIEQYHIIPFNSFASQKLQDLFRVYTLVGGMPEAVMQYAETKDILQLAETYENLLVSYIDDIEKYAKNHTQSQVLRHLINNHLNYANERISFGNFAQSNYGSREVSEAMHLLEKNLLIYLIYPTTNRQLPILPNRKRKPRLQALDTGLVNYFSKIQHLIIGSQDLSAVYNGKIIEHIIGQELLTISSLPLHKLNFWVRQKSGTAAEIDFVIPYEGKLIPIEVKAGKTGKLKSLHIFMNKTRHNMAVRLYAGKLTIDVIETNNKKYFLLNLPYFLTAHIISYLDWFKEEIKKLELKK